MKPYAACTAFIAGIGLTAVPACRDKRSDGARGEAVPQGEAVVPSALVEPAPPSATSSRGPVNALAVPRASVVSAVNPEGLRAYDGPMGVLEGTIAVLGDASPWIEGGDYHACPRAKDVYAPLFREGPPLAGGARSLADAVVAVTGYEGFYLPERAESKRIVFDDCAFGSRAVTLTFGQRLEIANTSSLVLAPTLDQAPTPALMVAAPAAPGAHGDPVFLYPPHPGYFTLRDRMGSDFVKLDVYVLLHPLHTVSDTRGHYRIEGVPAGTRTVHARVAAIGEASKTVDVRAGVVQTVDITLEYRR